MPWSSPDIVHGDDVGMIERGHRLRFALEALPPGVVLGNFLGEDF
jgi:hypothetical protein